MKKEFYKGKDCIQQLMKLLRSWSTWCFKKKQKCKILRISKDDRISLLNQDDLRCCLCGEEMEESQRVIHHCHLTGEIFGVAHSKCNLRARTTNFLPVFFHNLSRYDAHHIIKYLVIETGEKLSAIAKNDETYTSFSLDVPMEKFKSKKGHDVIQYHSLRFLDSFQFMSQSLDSLAKTLDKQDFKLLKACFPNITESIFEKLTRKGFFPYNFLDSLEKFAMPLPPYGPDWFNTLTQRIEITEQDYGCALEMYNAFHCQNLGDYHDIYLKSDVFILADIFQKFREVCMQVYRLDPAHFYSAPNLSWDVMLITTGVKMELMQDIDQLLFFEKAIRGGINGLGALRHFEANNKYLDNFNPEKDVTFGAFFDVTSLYAGTMLMEMPLGGYQWCPEITLNEILSTPNDSPVGYFVEVDLVYPPGIHDSHNDLPLAPEKLKIPKEWKSDYAKSFGLNMSSANEKLVETLLDKKNYICHYENLKFYVKHGLKVTTLHRAVKFQQSKWLGTYIAKNTVMRKSAANDFEKNFYKLMSNACFGKTMENLRRRSTLKFVSTETQAEAFIQRAIFKSFKIISKNLVTVSLKPSSVVWNKPTPVGASILDLSKLSLYKFHYEEMLPRYGADRLKVVYKDTDSLLYRIKTEDLYKDMATFKHLLDLSDYPADHFLHDKTNKKVPLTMTDELNGKVLKDVVCLRAKLYSIDYVEGTKQSAKGVQKSVKKTLHHNLFKDCLLSQSTVRRKMIQLKSASHQIIVNSVNKVALSCYDDKRYILDDTVSSLAYGHYSLKSSSRLTSE